MSASQKRWALTLILALRQGKEPAGTTGQPTMKARWAKAERLDSPAEDYGRGVGEGGIFRFKYCTTVPYGGPSKP